VDVNASFHVIEPEIGDSPLLVEVPHAGLALDPEAASWIAAPARSLARDADLYVDELFADTPALGGTLLCARLSRYVIDLNREEDDYDGATVVDGPARDRPRGVVWRLTSEGLPVLRDRLPASEYQRRCAQFYRPYHAALRRLLERKRERFGFAVMLCAHSMPTPRPALQRSVQTELDADLVPGTRGRTSASAEWIDLVERMGVARGWRVQHDIPYRGGFSTSYYGRPADGYHAVQIEIARRLYMDETTLARSPEGFATVRAFAYQLVAQMVRTAREACSAAARAHGPQGVS
jgi:N-formylglutamate amidohydrolase